MDRFADYMHRKLGMADALRAIIAAGANPYDHSLELLVGAIEPLLAAGVAAGELRSDISADDILKGISGVALAAGDNRETAGRLLDLLLDGLRYRSF
jgi:hypothetical protein